jgi:S1-C subfamily serine protease
MLKNIFKILAIFTVGMVGGIFSEQIFWPYFIEKPLFYEYGLENPPINVTERKEITIQENTALQESIKKVKDSVVGVRTKDSYGNIREGSGFVISSDGLIVTLAELVPAGSDFSFFVAGEKQRYEVKERDLEKNLALIKLERETLNAVSFGNIEEKELGERIFLVGKLFDEKGDPFEAVNEGIIKYFKEGFIHTDIFESRVLSGSPVFDIEGKVLGLSQIDNQGKLTVLPVSLIREFSGF